MTPSSTSVSVTVPVNQSQPLSTLSFSLQNVSEREGYTLVVDHAGNAIANVDQNLADFERPELTLYFISPHVLSPGTYSDTLRVRLCRDHQCTEPLTDTQAIQITYTVTSVTGSAAPAIIFSSRQVAFSAFLTDYPGQFPRPPSVAVSFSNVPVRPEVNVTSTHQGMNRVNFAFNEGDPLNGILEIYLHAPANLRPGTYSDVITLEACLDRDCRNPLPPQTVAVEYTVTNTVSGPNGYTVNVFNTQATAAVWDSSRSQFIISLPQNAVSNPNTLALLHPMTGAVQPLVALPASPSALAISDDQQYLYVGFGDSNLLQRYFLSSMSLDLSMSLPNYHQPYDSTTREIKVAPGAPRTIAVALTDIARNALGAIVFDDAVARSMTFGFIGTPPVNVVAFIEWGADTSTLYGCADDAASTADLYVLDVDGAGLHLSSRIPDAAGSRMHFAGGLIYGSTGTVFDPGSQSPQPTFGSSSENLFMVPAVDLGRAFFVVSRHSMDGLRSTVLQSYDLVTRAPIDSLALPGGYIPAGRRLIRWGADGLAYVNDYNNAFVVVSGKFVAP